ncbi:uncharacterized protein LOC131957809 [Physella acuta]|uniref:uncharacterized protein LOC131957809 n=1 Tax=Physella acuta TaxID=109671 RepID=UPI0027DCF361|nr:uncharacterized protein LOC131957809 [Physella acuta]
MELSEEPVQDYWSALTRWFAFDNTDTTNHENGLKIDFFKGDFSCQIHLFTWKSNRETFDFQLFKANFSLNFNLLELASRRCVLQAEAEPAKISTGATSDACVRSVIRVFVDGVTRAFIYGVI